MKTTVKRWLEEGTVDIFLGYRKRDGHALPHGFVRERLEEVDDLTDSPHRYPLEKIAGHLLVRQPHLTIGMPARDCSRRAIHVLQAFHQLPSQQIKTIEVNCCPSQLTAHADCSHLEPVKAGAHKRKKGIDNTLAPEDIEALDSDERLSRWLYEFEKCIKCYGCRNICPVCFCEECSLEHDTLVAAGPLPPDVPIFHLVRAVHMAGRCVDCGLCETVCPMNIPLRLLYRKVNAIVADLFDYVPGTSETDPPLNRLDDRVTLVPKPIGSC